jgi:hypothetical protein
VLSAAQIIAENALPGTSPDIWDISGSGSDNIQGFAAQISINKGERVDFKIDTDADDYRIDIYRLGYYQGLGARKITTINPNAALANNQPNAIVDFNTGLVDCGNWRVSASWDTPDNTVSGVYIAKLEREDGVFGESHIIFVVRDDEGQSDLLLQTSDTNWVAYSDYGGSSLYGNNFLPFGRAYEVSYNRPLTTRSRAESTFFFGAEYPMVRFLEANGFDVSYTTGVDTDRRGAELLEHKVFISVGHDEYWSGNQRANVEAARDAGVNLAFFSGNEVFWKIRWENSIDGSNTPYTTMVSYKETHDNAKTDPAGSSVWTGTWRDPRFSPPADGGRPENALTGQMFSVNGDSIIGRNITVNAEEGDLRFWRNTSVANLSGNQTTTLGDYVLGYEWDEDYDNGFRPAGLMRLSTTTANVSAYIQDYGNTYAPGTATHHLTLYRAASGALVFGAGTIQYSWGLDSFHDGPESDSDPDMQQATINLFADMGVQPGSLRPGLVHATMSTDFTKPFSTITAPTDGMVLSANTAFTIRGTAQDQGGGRVAGVEVSVDGGVTWHPAVGRENWTYTWTPRSSGMVNIRARAVDDSGNLETAGPGITINPSQNPGTYSLWDNGATPSTVDSGDNSPVEVGMRFRVDTAGHISSLRFYKAAANTGTHTAHLWSSNGTLLASATFTGETNSGWQQVDFATPVAVAPGETYVASYTAPNGRYSLNRNYFTTLGVDNGPLHAVQDGALGTNGVYNYNAGSFPSQSYQASNYWVDVVFTTEVEADTTAPTVTRFGQAGGASVVTVASAFTVTFSEAINPSSVNTNTITLVKPDNRLIPGGCCPTPGGWCSGCPLLNAVNNTAVAATVSYDAVAKTATVTPTGALEPSTIYTIIVGAGGVKDLAGNSLATDIWSSFYTSNQPAPVVSTFFSANTVPTSVDGGDNEAVELGMRFTADSDGQITGARFYKAANNTGTHTASLWSNNGQRLATATFSGETASGWQQVNFATPVSVTAGTTYVISYHTNTGHYSFARNYFNSPQESGPLNTPANAGVYAYGANSAFPSQSYQGSNYYVDAVFSTTPAGDTVAPTVINFNPFEGTSSVPVNPTVKVYFSEDLNASTVTTATVKLLDGGNNAVPATLSYDAATRTATLTPTSSLAYATNYTIFVLGGSAGIRDLAGNTMAQNTVSAFTTDVGPVQDTTPPTITAVNPVNGALAVSTTPTLTVTFSEPMNAATVKSTTVYLLKQGTQLVPTTFSYNAATNTATLVPVSPLLSSTSYTIFVLGGTSGVRDLSGNALVQNVASVFETIAASPGDLVAPTIVSFAPTGSGVSVNSPVTVTFSEALDPASVNGTTVQLRNSISGLVVTSTLSYTAGGTAVTLTPTSPLSPSTNYLVVVQGGANGVKDVAGNPLVNTATSGFTTAAPADTTAPTVTAFNPVNGSTSVPTGSAASVTFSEAMNASTINTSTVFLRNSSNVVVAASVAYNATTNTATITPTSALANSTTYTIVVQGGASGVKDAAGNALAAVATSSFTTVAVLQNPASHRLWSDTTTPATVDSGDNGALELGVRFSSTSDGFITGIRFYKSAANTGTHTGSLWTSNGQLLATATFTNETASGWQLVTFSSPVAITAGTTYVASYHTNSGHYSVNRNYFNQQYTNGLLRVPSNGGVYRYGNTSAFPNNTFQRSNYWVDVAMTTTAPADTMPPTVTGFSPAGGSTNVPITTAATVTFSEALNASTVNASTIFVRDASNAVVPTTLAYNATTRTATLTPTSALANSTTYTIVVKGGAAGVKDAAGNALAADAISSFTTAAITTPPATPPSSLWSTSTTPATVDSGDNSALELGVRFSATVNGLITGIRFYKSAANTGTHTANLWTADGQLLATATFTNETASGWQTVLFDTPIAITAGTTYVASYYTTSGHYAVNRNYFNSQYSSGPLRVAANGGVYRYGNSSAFPNSSYQGSNYWVDVLFVPEGS